MPTSRSRWRGRRGARDDLRIVVMSATLDTRTGVGVSGRLSGCRRSGTHVPAGDRLRARTIRGRVSMRRTAEEWFGPLLPAWRARDSASGRRPAAEVPADVEVLPLHGSLDVDAQSRAIEPSTGKTGDRGDEHRRDLVDRSGRHRRRRYRAAQGRTLRCRCAASTASKPNAVTLDAADQRAGRAGRIAAGIVRRLWDARDRLRPHREPDIQRVDLSSAALDIVAWGADPRTFEWFERPHADALASAFELLTRSRCGRLDRPPDGDRGAGATDAAASAARAHARGRGWKPRHRARPARCCRSAISSHRARRRRPRICCRRSTGGMPCRHRSAVPRTKFSNPAINLKSQSRLRSFDFYASYGEARRSALGAKAAESEMGEAAFRRAVLSPVIPTALPNAANLGRQTFCLRAAVARSSLRKAASVMASF